MPLPVGLPMASRVLCVLEGVSAMDYTDVLRCLTINDSGSVKSWLRDAEAAEGGLDPKARALARIAALVAVGGAVPSYGAHADAAVSAGATPAEIVEVLVDLVPIVGLPCVVAAAPKVAIALGYDTDDALEHQSGN
jgi:4-carboxymuconolactone decarboxylase